VLEAFGIFGNTGQQMFNFDDDSDEDDSDNDDDNDEVPQ